MLEKSDEKLVITRRNWAAVLVAAPLVAQVQSSAPKTPPPVAASVGNDVRKVSERLAQIEVPMSVEPAFTFRP